MRASMDQTTPGTSSTIEPSTPTEDTTNLGNKERAIGRHVQLFVRSRVSSQDTPTKETELQTRPSSDVSTTTGAFIKRKTLQLLDAMSVGCSLRTGGFSLGSCLVRGMFNANVTFLV
jgi:hypothetical protein